MNVMFLFLIEFCSKIELCKAHQGSECFRLVFSSQFHNKINLINYTHPPVDLTQTIFGIHIIRIWNIPKRSSKLSIPKLSFCSCLVSKMFWNSFEKFIKYFLRTKPKNHVQSGIINFVYVKNHKKTRKTTLKRLFNHFNIQLWLLEHGKFTSLIIEIQQTIGKTHPTLTVHLNKCGFELELHSSTAPP